jgi:CHRD domain
MEKLRRFIPTVAGAVLLLAAFSAFGQNGETFKARLSTVPVDATMLPTVAGSGSVKAALAGNKLTISGSFEGLRSPATRGSIHIGPQKGIRGPAAHDLTVSKAIAGSVSGSVDLTSSEVQDLRDGRFYVQVDSERAPDGNLWGWLLR